MVRKTEDSGSSWEVYDQYAKATQDLYGVGFVNKSTGWVVGAAGTVLGTRDTGGRWKQESPGQYPDLYAISVNASGGVFAGDKGSIARLKVLDKDGNELNCAAETTAK